MHIRALYACASHLKTAQTSAYIYSTQAQVAASKIYGAECVAAYLHCAKVCLAPAVGGEVPVSSQGVATMHHCFRLHLW
jgi:hypothetical protein